jgi:hypothetical protein
VDKDSPELNLLWIQADQSKAYCVYRQVRAKPTVDTGRPELSLL